LVVVGDSSESNIRSTAESTARSSSGGERSRSHQAGRGADDSDPPQPASARVATSGGTPDPVKTEGGHTIRIWLTLLLGAVVLIGCGIFFAFQGLGDATEYASVASVFLALITTVASMLSFARIKAGKERGTHPRNETEPRANPTQTISGCDVAMTGKGARAKVTINVGYDATASAKGSREARGAALHRGRIDHRLEQTNSWQLNGS
jgi:hypothetical protein